MVGVVFIDDSGGDTPGVARALRERFPSLVIVDRREIAIEEICDREPDVIVFGLSETESEGGLQVAALQGRLPGTVFVTIGSEAARAALPERVRMAVIAHLTRPVCGPALTSLLTACSARIAPPQASANGMIGASLAMQRVSATIDRVASSDVTVMITGETGTGKDLAARAVHARSRRAKGPFVAVNCAALADGVLESELFGHERGAFTGAMARRIGRFEQANGGTIFLDEIGDTSPQLQARLLRVMQDRTIERVGCNETIEIDVRVIAATHRDLARLRDNGRFREDLYYRLSVVALHLPPLRERKEDIRALVEFFAARHAIELGRPLMSVTPAALEVMKQYDWPGNVRELEHCLKQAIVLGDGASIGPNELPFRDTWRRAKSGDDVNLDGAGLGVLARDLLRDVPGRAHERFIDRVERVLFAETLRLTSGNLSRAAWLLGLSRPTVRARLARLDLRDEVGSDGRNDNELVG